MADRKTGRAATRHIAANQGVSAHRATILIPAETNTEYEEPVFPGRRFFLCFVFKIIDKLLASSSLTLCLNLLSLGFNRTCTY